MNFNHLNFLVVDNDKLVRLLLSRLLKKKFRCDVFEAEDGLQALSVIKEHRPDLILLDITMPVMDGVEVLENLRANSEFRDTPVIIMSSTDERNTVMKLVTLKIADYILKPIDIAKAYERIQKIVDNMPQPIAIPKNAENTSTDAETQAQEDVAVQNKLLIIHKDEQYRKKLVAAYSGAYEVSEASSGIDGLQAFLKGMPPFVIIGEALSLLNETQLTKKMKDKKNVVVVHIQNEKKQIESSVFDAIVVKNENIEELKSQISNYIP